MSWNRSSLKPNQSGFLAFYNVPSPSFEQGWLDEKGVRGVSPVKVIDVPHELSTSPLLYRLADTHPQLLDEQGQFKEKVGNYSRDWPIILFPN